MLNFAILVPRFIRNFQKQETSRYCRLLTFGLKLLSPSMALQLDKLIHMFKWSEARLNRINYEHMPAKDGEAFDRIKLCGELAEVSVSSLDFPEVFRSPSIVDGRSRGTAITFSDGTVTYLVTPQMCRLYQGLIMMAESGSNARFRYLAILSSPGTGKSTLALFVALAEMLNKRSVLVGVEPDVWFFSNPQTRGWDRLTLEMVDSDLKTWKLQLQKVRFVFTDDVKMLKAIFLYCHVSPSALKICTASPDANVDRRNSNCWWWALHPWTEVELALAVTLCLKPPVPPPTILRAVTGNNLREISQHIGLDLASLQAEFEELKKSDQRLLQKALQRKPHDRERGLHTILEDVYASTDFLELDSLKRPPQRFRHPRCIAILLALIYLKHKNSLLLTGKVQMYFSSI